MKTCSKCASAKPATDFSGKRAQCRRCDAAEARAWRQNNRDKVIAQKRRAYARNPAKKVAEVAAWRKANPDKYAEQVRRRQTPERIAEGVERLKAWKAVPGNTLASGQRYRARHPDKVAERTRRYQAAKRKAVPAWANPEAMAMKYAEAQWLTDVSGVPHEVDHIVPLISSRVCGLHCEANLQVLPRFANRSKSNRHWPEEVAHV